MLNYSQSEIAFTDHNGSGLYKGQLSPNEKRQGHGRMEWTSESSPLRGSVYEGAWKNDMVTNQHIAMMFIA